MFNKQLYLIVVTGLLMIGGLFPSSRTLAVSSSEHESVPLTQYWNIIANHLAESLIARGRIGINTVYVDRKHTALDVARYLEKQLSVSLRKSDVKVTAPTNARYVIELDVKIRDRSNGMGTVYAEGGDIDQLWEIKAFSPLYSGQYAHYEMIPLTMNRPVTINPLSGTDTEVMITARIMERGWILVSQNYAFYLSSEQTRRENKPVQKSVSKTEKIDTANDALFLDQQNHKSAFLNYQEKLDNHIQQLIDSYQFDVNF